MMKGFPHASDNQKTGGRVEGDTRSALRVSRRSEERQINNGAAARIAGTGVHDEKTAQLRVGEKKGVRQRGHRSTPPLTRLQTTGKKAATTTSKETPGAADAAASTTAVDDDAPMREEEGERLPE